MEKQKIKTRCCVFEKVKHWGKIQIKMLTVLSKTQNDGSWQLTHKFQFVSSQNPKKYSFFIIFFPHFICCY